MIAIINKLLFVSRFFFNQRYHFTHIITQDIKVTINIKLVISSIGDLIFTIKYNIILFTEEKFVLF